jgi:RNA polymerase-binding transcription factor DksA
MKMSAKVSPQDREEIKQVIFRNIAKVKKEIASLEEGSQFVSPETLRSRILGKATVNNYRGLKETALRLARLDLLRLEHALSLVDKPSFGICARCEIPIPKTTLLSHPEATKCKFCE